MEHTGLDPSTALRLIQSLLYSLALILGGAVLLGLSAYIVFLCVEIFSPQPCSKARLAKLPHPIGCAPVAEENLDLSVADTLIPAEAESLGEEAVRVSAHPHNAANAHAFGHRHSGERTHWALRLP